PRRRCSKTDRTHTTACSEDKRNSLFRTGRGPTFLASSSPAVAWPAAGAGKLQRLAGRRRGGGLVSVSAVGLPGNQFLRLLRRAHAEHQASTTVSSRHSE